jgi:hypothetical protein
MYLENKNNTTGAGNTRSKKVVKIKLIEIPVKN